MPNNKNPDEPTRASSIGGFVVTVIMGLAGLATAGLIVYVIVRALLIAVFGIALPNPFPWIVRDAGHFLCPGQASAFRERWAGIQEKCAEGAILLWKSRRARVPGLIPLGYASLHSPGTRKDYWLKSQGM
jgi:hypothetical protein